MFNESYLTLHDPVSARPKVTFQTYQTWAASKAAGDLTEREAALTWALGLSDETIEARKAYYRATGNGQAAAPAVLDELGDILWYAALLANQVSIHGLTFPTGRPPVSLPTDAYLDGVLDYVGNAQGLIKKAVSHGHGYPLTPGDQSKLHKQLQAIIDFIARTAAKLGSSLDEVARRNMAKLDDRYDGGFTAEASLNRQGGNGAGEQGGPYG